MTRDNFFQNTRKKLAPDRISSFRETSVAVAKKNGPENNAFEV